MRIVYAYAFASVVNVLMAFCSLFSALWVQDLPARIAVYSLNAITFAYTIRFYSDMRKHNASVNAERIRHNTAIEGLKTAHHEFMTATNSPESLIVRKVM